MTPPALPVPAESAPPPDAAASDTTGPPAGRKGAGATGTGLTDIIDGGYLLIIGFPEELDDTRIAEATMGVAQGRLTIERPRSLAEIETLLREHPVRVLAIGPESRTEDGVAIEPEEVVNLLGGLEQEHLRLSPAILLVGDYEGASLLSLIQDDRLYFFSPAPMDHRQVLALLAAGFAHSRKGLLLDLAALGQSRDQRVLEERKLLATAESLAHISDVQSFEDPLLEALDECLDMDAGRLWIYDSLRHTLRAASTAELEVSAVAGITSFAARTGKVVRLASAATDPRFDFEADEGAEGPLLAVPIRGAEGRVLAVLVALRHDGKAPFSDSDQDLLQRFAEHLAPHLVLRTTRPFAARQLRMSQDVSLPDIFRSEALEANERSFTDTGRVLENSPGWTRWTWMVVVAGFVSALIFSLLGSMHEYAGGPALVRIGQRIDVAAQVAASVIDVQAEPGARVRDGEPLARLYGVAEAAEIANLEDELDQLLRQRLAAPEDTAVEASLIDTRTALERARARLSERLVRSPTEGVIGDVRIRPGQHLEAGEVLLSVISDQEARSVVGLIPGQFGPQISAGQRFRLTLVGYPDLSLDLEVSSVGEEVISPREARLALGGSAADSLVIGAPVVLVEGRLDEGSFEDGTRQWAFRDGMEGTMEIRVRSRPILLHLIPGLEKAFRRWYD